MISTVTQPESARRPVRRRIAGTVCRPGYTLMEMLLVLSLLMTFLALAWPSLSRLHKEQQLRQGAAQVAIQITAARLHALESGIPYQFRFEPGGKRFLVVPADYQALMNEAASAGQIKYWKTSGRFQSKIEFDQSAAVQAVVRAQPLPPQFLEGFPDADELGQVAWGPAIIFHPDGTTTDETITITDAEKMQVQLTIRGLTGSTDVSQLQRRPGA